MPLGAPPLAKSDVEIVRDWIKAGAHDDSPKETLSNEPTVYHQPPVITALRFSPDGKWLAVSGNREVLLHDANGAGLVKRLSGKAERILSLAFSSDGDRRWPAVEHRRASVNCSFGIRAQALS